MKAYTIDSFAKTTDGGNGAGVVLDADHLSEAEMQKIATIVGLSETAFVLGSDLADFKIRFFTPKEEVDLCGHATIGTFYTMATLGYVSPGNYFQETKAGVLGIEVMENETILMNQPLPHFYELIDKNVVADSLGIEENDISKDLPVQIVSTGLKDIIVPVKNLDTLNSLKPDFDKISKISNQYNVIGYHVFTLETTSPDSTACCRNFAPLVAIPEEAATGTSNGALGCYLFHYGKLSNTQAKHIVIEQGYAMKKPSEILVSLTGDCKKITEVKVGGRALNLSQVEINLI